jgi:hypothetical protein
MTKTHSKRARRQRRQAEVDPIEMRPIEMRLDELSELGRFAFQAARRVGVDSCAGISDDDIALALIEEPILLCAAKHLSDLHGRVIDGQDLAARIAASARLHNVRNIAKAFHDHLMLARCEQVIAEHAEAEHARELAREARHRRNRGPRCGARTRTGQPCKRKVVLGRTRCPNHGGCTTGPKTPEGKARCAEGRRQAWARRRAGK